MEMPKELKLGRSLLVPSVQELVKENLVEIPPRYLQPDQKIPIITDASLPQLSVPIIDLQNLLSPGSIGEMELEKLHSACKEWGFFQVVNHGVSYMLVEKVKSETQEFFKLPMAEKKKYWQNEGEVEGFGQHFVVSEEQKLDWSDLFFLTTLPIYRRKPHLLPELPLSFRDAIESYSLELKNLAMTFMKVMARALQIETNVIEDLFEDGLQSMRMNYYPPCPQPERVVGFKPHSDAVALTVLLQLNEVQGLQVTKDGEWVPIKPLPNALIVNIGDIFEILTNGIYRSVQHRAVVNSTKERLSIATFLSPKVENEIGPIDSLITPSTPSMFKRVGVEKYFHDLFSRELDGKSYLEFMKIENNTT